MRKAKSRLPKKEVSNVRVFIMGFVLGSGITLGLALHFDNVQLRDIYNTVQPDNQCTENMCYELPGVQPNTTQRKYNKIITQVKAKSTAPTPSTESQKRVYNIITDVWGVDSDFGHRLAFCESTYGQNVSNTQSSARGIFQFLSGTWIEQRNYEGSDPALNARLLEAENIKTAYNHYKRMGARPWLASQHCWN